MKQIKYVVLYTPVALGHRDYHRLSSVGYIEICNPVLDNKQLSLFSNIMTSLTLLILYIIVNTRGLSALLNWSWLDGAINFHQFKPRGDTKRLPQSRAFLGLAKSLVI